MKSKFIQSTAAIAMVLAWGAAAAQANPNFIGPAVGIAVSAQTSKTPLNSGVPTLNGRSVQADDTATSLLGSWGFALSDQWVATLGLSLDLNSTNLGKANYGNTGTFTLSTRAKDHLSVFIAPGYRLAPDFLVYGKLAYHQFSNEYTDASPTASVTSTVNHTGTGYGLGVAMALTAKTELRAEYETVQYNEQKVALTSGKPEHSLLTLGLLYKF